MNIFARINTEFRNILRDFKNPTSDFYEDTTARNNQIDRINQIIHSDNSALFSDTKTVWEDFQQTIPSLLNLRTKILSLPDRSLEMTDFDENLQELLNLKNESVWKKFKNPELLQQIEKEIDRKSSEIKLQQIKLLIIYNGDPEICEAFILAKEVIASNMLPEFFSIFDSWHSLRPEHLAYKKVSEKMKTLILEISDSINPDLRSLFLNQVALLAKNSFPNVALQAELILEIEDLELMDDLSKKNEARLVLIEKTVSIECGELAISLAKAIVSDASSLEAKKHDKLLRKLLSSLKNWGLCPPNKGLIAKKLSLDIAFSLSDPEKRIKELTDLTAHFVEPKHCEEKTSDSILLAKQAAIEALDHAIKAPATIEIQNCRFEYIHSTLEKIFTRISKEAHSRLLINNLRSISFETSENAVISLARDVLLSIQTIKLSDRKNLLIIELLTALKSSRFWNSQEDDPTEKFVELMVEIAKLTENQADFLTEIEINFKKRIFQSN